MWQIFIGGVQGGAGKLVYFLYTHFSFNKLQLLIKIKNKRKKEKTVLKLGVLVKLWILDL